MKNSKDEIQLEKDLLIETLKAKVKHYKKKLVKIKKQLSLCSVSCSVIVVESPSGQGYTGEIKGVYHQLTDKLKEDAKSKWWVCTEYEVKHYR